MVQHPNSPPPAYTDLEAFFAGLSLEGGPAGPAPSTATTLPAPAVPPPQPRTPSPPPYGRRAVYQVSSPTRGLELTPDWSEAAHTAHNEPGARVRALRRNPKKRGSKSVYVVFRGHTIGIKNTWAEVEQATLGFRFAQYQGYRSRAVAQATFLHAQQNGWTSTNPAWTAVPISAALAPHPIADHQGNPSPPVIARREAHQPWHIVYVGVHPGIFATYLECALNVLGIDGSWNDRAETFAEAQAKFARAVSRGEIMLGETKGWRTSCVEYAGDARCLVRGPALERNYWSALLHALPSLLAELVLVAGQF
ncbi:hypothetical protein FB45DRAFT_877903 [Roridomyces roridus]|uniref:Ribonuclease H1 N-terminal domain-containing protein n=1 Tax=Roridomyces roridus TaxID=1738132 RepID=A0AAD7B0R2_9AGAR|nr:hypothetical protein FB45DRAFT_877903 [Roridomyces roridus]